MTYADKKKHSSKVVCNKCKRLVRVKYCILNKEGIVCNNCKPHLIGGYDNKLQFTLEQTLNRTYEVCFNISKKTGLMVNCGIRLPNILAGHKVKLVLVDEKKNKE